MVPVIGGEGSRVKYPVVTRATLGVVYKVMMAILEKKLTYGVTKDPIWSKAVETLVMMTTSLKTWYNRSLLSAVLKQSRLSMKDERWWECCY